MSNISTSASSSSSSSTSSSSISSSLSSEDEYSTATSKNEKSSLEDEEDEYSTAVSGNDSGSSASSSSSEEEVKKVSPLLNSSSDDDNDHHDQNKSNGHGLRKTEHREEKNALTATKANKTFENNNHCQTKTTPNSFLGNNNDDANNNSSIRGKVCKEVSNQVNGATAETRNNAHGLSQHTSPLFARDDDDDDDDNNDEERKQNHHNFPSSSSSFPSTPFTDLCSYKPSFQTQTQLQPQPPQIPLPEKIQKHLLSTKNNLLSHYKTYKHFLHQNTYLLSLVEDLLHRFLYYAAPLSSSNGNTELLYALLNIWSFFNSVVLDGRNGENVGMTCGKLHEFLKEKDDGEMRRNVDRYLWKASSAFQFMLATIECIAPVFEIHGSSSSSSLSEEEDDVEEDIYPHPQPYRKITLTKWRKHKLRSARLSHTWNTLYKLELLKFVSRAGIVGVYVWGLHSRLLLEEKEKNNNQKEKRSEGLLCAGILQENGVYRPGCHDEEEDVSTLHEEEERMERLCYYGKRTGRRIVTTTRKNGGRYKVGERATQQQQHKLCKEEKNENGGSVWLSNSVNNLLCTINSKLGTNVSPSSTNKRIKLFTLTMGELLHIYRPFYWSSKMKSYYFRQRQHGQSNSKIDLLKPLIKAFLMDVMSHYFTKIALSTNHSQQGGGGGGEKEHKEKIIPNASNATNEELQRRKVRWMLYMLRSPVWDLFTNPILTVPLSKVVKGCLPGWIGRTLVNYVLDVLLYWQRHHFMLEG